MPCYTEPTPAWVDRIRDLAELIREIEGKRFNHKHRLSDEVWDKKLLQVYTKKLCKWCKENPEKVKSSSLELQIWWRDHQEEDARHEREAKEKLRKAKLRKKALAKLSHDEKLALGLNNWAMIQFELDDEADSD